MKYKRCKQTKKSKRKVYKREKPLKISISKTASATKKAAIAGRALAKKHVTKANIKKALDASRAATRKLASLFKKKQKEPKGARVTMTLFRK